MADNSYKNIFSNLSDKLTTDLNKFGSNVKETANNVYDFTKQNFKKYSTVIAAGGVGVGYVGSAIGAFFGSPETVEAFETVKHVSLGALVACSANDVFNKQGIAASKDDNPVYQAGVATKDIVVYTVVPFLEDTYYGAKEAIQDKIEARKEAKAQKEANREKTIDRILTEADLPEYVDNTNMTSQNTAVVIEPTELVKGIPVGHEKYLPLDENKNSTTESDEKL